MSYYPTERRGGCMESLSRCCRQAYVYPLDTRKLLYAAGAVVGVILVAVIWSGLSSSDDSSPPQPHKGSAVLLETPLVVGSNFFSSNLRRLASNNIYKVSFDKNLKNDSVFGNANCTSCQTDLPRLQSGLVGSQIWSISVPCDAIYKDAVSLTLEEVDAMSRLIYHYPSNLTLIKSSTNVNDAFNKNQLGSILGVSSGHSIDGRMSVLRSLYALGVRVMALTSSCSTSWAASYTDSNDNGLSDFGKTVVKEMNRLGILIDLSGTSHKTQLQVLNVTKAPVIFSHAAAFSLVNESRNIQDDVLQLMKTNKGLVMVTFADKYITKNISNAGINDVIAHINHIKNVTGVTGVGIGAEFDAEDQAYPAQLDDVSTFPILFDQLGSAWNNQDDLKKLAGDNFLRVLHAVEELALTMSSTQPDETYKLPNNSTCYSDYDKRENNKETTVTTNAPTVSTKEAITTTPIPKTTQATAATAAQVTTTAKPTTSATEKTTPPITQKP